MQDIGTIAAQPAGSGIPAPPAGSDGAGALRGALLDSRQRLRDLVLLAADLAFETDANGRFAFIIPDPSLGWGAATLIGQPAELLLAQPGDAEAARPFHPTSEIRHRRAWVKRADGSTACLSFSAAPLFDAEGRIVGARGIGIDVTRQDGTESQVAAALRRGEVLDHILRRVDREVLAPRMLRAALDALTNALGAEGAAVIEIADPDGRAALRHQAGGAAAAVLDDAARLLRQPGHGPQLGTAAGRRQLVVAGCQTRLGDQVGLAIWRVPGGRSWDDEDQLLIAASVRLIRFALEHEALQREMTRQARTDPLTGLLNRRAFMDELTRHVERLDRENLPGTILFADLDNFKPVNDQLGHEAGDEVLVRAADLLRAAVRPSDLVARLGGDEFAVWLNGADQLTAAERADALCRQSRQALAETAGAAAPALSLSIGIATRHPGSGEPVDEVIRRADLAMYQVKRRGRGHWHVAQEEDI
jgi:diguanylate cyclase (GGDEF)-like protein/PAS domain S-box-containing protein